MDGRMAGLDALVALALGPIDDDARGLAREPVRRVRRERIQGLLRVDGNAGLGAQLGQAPAQQFGDVVPAALSAELLGDWVTL